VRVVGRQSARIDRSGVAALLETAERIGFFDFDSSYTEIKNPDGSRWQVTDLPTKIVTVTANGRSRRVEDYVGAPATLEQFERDIDSAAGTVRWIFVDPPTLQTLLRSGWSASSEEGATLLRTAIERDDTVVAQALIEAGADINGLSERRPPPLLSARSASMVDILVKAGADPNGRSTRSVVPTTPLMTTAYKDAAVAEALLRAGARLEDLQDGRSALWYAACAGNWRVVAVLLRAGARPRGAANITALQCTRDARRNRANNQRSTPFDRGRPTVADFDRVIELLEAAEAGRRP
jgi:hypothetical protein